MGDGDWGMGIGDWGLGPIPNPQSPIPNPQSPYKIKRKQNIKFKFYLEIILILFKINFYFYPNLFKPKEQV